MNCKTNLKKIKKISILVTIVLLQLFAYCTQYFAIARPVSISENSELSTQYQTTELRLLLNFYYSGELFGGAFYRSSFESYFEHVGYYNTEVDINSWEAFDVICTSFDIGFGAAVLEQDDIDAFRAFLSHGGGLIILHGWNSDPALEQIDPSLRNDGEIYYILGGIVVTGVDRNLAVAGTFDAEFDLFLEAVRIAGENRVGKRSITPEIYYGIDTVLYSDRIEMTVESSRSSEYELDIIECEKSMANMEQFLGFTIDRKIQVYVKPMALTDGIFAFGISNTYDRVAFARPPGMVRGIFGHECGHIYEYEFYDRYFDIPGFGVGVIQTAAEDEPDWSRPFRENWGLRCIYLIYTLIDLVGPSNMQIFFDSLNSYPKEYIPDENYWSSIYIYPEEGSEFLHQGSNIINFYFSRAFNQNYYSTIKSWGYELTDWEPVWSIITEVEYLFSLLDDPEDYLLSLQNDMLISFYKGDFDTAFSYGNQLRDTLKSVLFPPANLYDINNYIFTAPTNSVYYIPTGNIYDDSALYAFYAYTGNPQIITSPTQSPISNAYIDNEGKPLFLENIVTFGGRIANRMVRYFEENKIAKVGYGNNGTHHLFTNIYDGSPLYAIDLATYNENERDYFVIQLYVDGNRYILSEWGICAEGTYAGGLCFIDKIWPNIESYSNQYYIFSWTDSNNDDMPQPEEITLETSGS